MSHTLILTKDCANVFYVYLTDVDAHWAVPGGYPDAVTSLPGCGNGATRSW